MLGDLGRSLLLPLTPCSGLGGLPGACELSFSSFLTSPGNQPSSPSPHCRRETARQCFSRRPPAHRPPKRVHRHSRFTPLVTRRRYLSINRGGSGPTGSAGGVVLEGSCEGSFLFPAGFTPRLLQYDRSVVMGSTVSKIQPGSPPSKGHQW